MKASVVCLLFASLLVIVLPRGNESHILKKRVDDIEYGRQLFKQYDKDSNGYLSPHEVRMYVSEFGSNQTPEELMEIFDKNKDNQISFEEFHNDQ